MVLDRIGSSGIHAAPQGSRREGVTSGESRSPMALHLKPDGYTPSQSEHDLLLAIAEAGSMRRID